MLYAMVSLGVLLVITSFLGCSGATTQTRCIVVVHVVIMTLALCLEVAVAAYILTSPEEFDSFSLNIWNHMNAQEQLSYEDDNGCAGYDACSVSIEETMHANLVIISW